MQLKSILCPIDCSDFSAAAFRHALSLAEYYNSRIIALHVVEMWKYPFADYAAQEADYARVVTALNEGGEAKLKEFVKQHANDRIQPEIRVHQGNAPNCILSLAQKENVEIIVMGTHGRRGLDRLVLGSTTDRVIRKVACPVLVVSNPAQSALNAAPDGRHHLNRVLYCTDFSHNSDQARDYAVSVAAEYQAELTLLHVASNRADAKSAEMLIAERKQELDRLIPAKEHRDFELKSVVRVGRPYEEIIRHATETQAGLIIMTARGGDAMDRAVFGSTTYRVIQFGPSPVLAIHT